MNNTVVIYDCGCGIVRGYVGTIGTDEDVEAMISSQETYTKEIVEFAKTINPRVEQIEFINIREINVSKISKELEKDYCIYIETSEDVEKDRKIRELRDEANKLERTLQKRLID